MRPLRQVNEAIADVEARRCRSPHRTSRGIRSVQTARSFIPTPGRACTRTTPACDQRSDSSVSHRLCSGRDRSSPCDQRSALRRVDQPEHTSARRTTVDPRHAERPQRAGAEHAIRCDEPNAHPSGSDAGQSGCASRRRRGTADDHPLRHFGVSPQCQSAARSGASSEPRDERLPCRPAAAVPAGPTDASRSPPTLPNSSIHTLGRPSAGCGR